jgi:hypothetical protein
MLRKVSLTSLQDASLVVRPEKPVETTAEEAAVAAEEKEKCILRYVQNAELLQKFHSCLKTTDPSIAASASKHVGKGRISVIA